MKKAPIKAFYRKGSYRFNNVNSSVFLIAVVVIVNAGVVNAISGLIEGRSGNGRTVGWSRDVRRWHDVVRLCDGNEVCVGAVQFGVLLKRPKFGASFFGVFRAFCLTTRTNCKQQRLQGNAWTHKTCVLDQTPEDPLFVAVCTIE